MNLRVDHIGSRLRIFVRKKSRRLEFVLAIEPGENLLGPRILELDNDVPTIPGFLDHERDRIFEDLLGYAGQFGPARVRDLAPPLGFLLIEKIAEKFPGSAGLSELQEPVFFRALIRQGLLSAPSLRVFLADQPRERTELGMTLRERFQFLHPH